MYEYIKELFNDRNYHVLMGKWCTNCGHEQVFYSFILRLTFCPNCGEWIDMKWYSKG